MTIPKSQKLHDEEKKSAPGESDSNAPLKNFSSCEQKPAKACSGKCAKKVDWTPLNGLVIVKSEKVDPSIIITNVNNMQEFKYEGVVVSVASDVSNVAVGDYVKFSKAGIVSDNLDPTDSAVVLINHKMILCSR